MWYTVTDMATLQDYRDERLRKLVTRLRSHHGMDEYIEAMKRHSAHRGEEAGVEFAEAFIQHRGHPFPQNDLLAELFGD